MNLWEALEADVKRVRGRFSFAEVWAKAEDGATLCARQVIGKTRVQVYRCPPEVSVREAYDRGLVEDVRALDDVAPLEWGSWPSWQGRGK